MAQIDRDFDKLMFGKKHHLFGGKRNPKNYRWTKRSYGKNVITWQRKPGHTVWVEKVSGSYDKKKKLESGWQVYTEKAHMYQSYGSTVRHKVFNKSVSKKEAMQTAMGQMGMIDEHGLG